VIEADAAAGAVFRFAHLSDPHLSDLSQVRLHQLASKRLLGYLSWRRRRRSEHRPEVLQRLLADMRSQSPDHVLVTGDLTHISLPHEFKQVRAWLQGIGDAAYVTVVPGNHDQYVPIRWSQSVGLWNDYMVSDGEYPGVGEALRFPTVRVRGPVVFIGLNTAVYAAPLFATGSLGTEQLQRLRTLLREMHGRDLLRILILHHPPVPGTEKWRKRLVDAAQLRTTLEEFPVDAVLHGHSHRPMRSEIAVRDRTIPVFGIASASAAGMHSIHRSEYNLFEVSRQARCWTVRVVARRMQADRNSYRGEQLALLRVDRPPRD